MWIYVFIVFSESCNIFQFTYKAKDATQTSTPADLSTLLAICLGNKIPYSPGRPGLVINLDIFKLDTLTCQFRRLGQLLIQAGKLTCLHGLIVCLAGDHILVIVFAILCGDFENRS